MQRLIKNGLTSEAVALLEDMKINHVYPNTPVFNTLIGGFARGGNLNQSFKLFNMLKKHGSKPDPRTYTLMFTAISRANDKQFSKEVLEKLREEVKRADIKPSTYIQNALMLALIRLGNYEEAFEIFENMKYMDIKPDKYAYSALMSAFIDEGSVEEALYFLREVQKKRIPVNTYIYHTFFKVCANAKTEKDRMKAFEIFEEMKKNPFTRPNSVTYSMLLSIAKSVGTKQLEKFMEEVLHEVQKGNFELDVGGFNSILGILTKLDDERAFQFFNIFEKKLELDENSYSLMMRITANSYHSQAQKIASSSNRDKKEQIVSLKDDYTEKCKELHKRLCDERIPRTQTIFCQMARLARITENPELALWIRALMKEEKVIPNYLTLHYLLETFGENSAYQAEKKLVSKEINEFEELDLKEDKGIDKAKKKHLQDEFQEGNGMGEDDQDDFFDEDIQVAKRAKKGNLPKGNYKKPASDNQENFKFERIQKRQ